MVNIVSVVMPIFNAEQFIEKSILSLCNQTLKDFEIVLIDDCSIDNSMQKAKDILQSYPHRLASTKFIKLSENVGSSKARKLAFQQVSGDYITCLDSDDYLEENALELMLNKALEMNAELVVCDFYLTYPDKEKRVQQITSGDSYLSDLLLNKLHGSYCNKLYKKSLLDKTVILENVDFMEDYLFSIQAGIYTNKIAYLNYPVLHYVQHNPNSYTYSYSEKSLDDIIVNTDFIVNLFKEYKLSEKYKEALSYRKLYSKFMVVCNASTRLIRHKYYNLYLNETEGYKYLSPYHKSILFAANLKSDLLVDLIIYLKNMFKKIKSLI